MKKILYIIVLISILFNSLIPTYAYNKIDHAKDQSYVKQEKRLISKITNASLKGDYLITGRETIRMYDDECGQYNYIECLGTFMLTVYYNNHYENRELVVTESYTAASSALKFVDTTYKKVAIKENQKSYGKFFEINYFQVLFYEILGYDVDYRTTTETKNVFDIFKFKYVKKQVKVTEYWARKVTNQQVIVGYKDVIDEKAHWETVNIKKIVPPTTQRYRAFLYEEGFGVNGALYGYGEGVKRTIKLGSEIIEAVKTLDETKITFIKDGQKYLAKVLTKVDNTSQLVNVFVTDTYTGVTTTISFAFDHYTKNPDQISNLVGELTYAIGTAHLVGEIGKKIDIKLIDVDAKVINIYSKYKNVVPGLLVKYGNTLSQIVTKFGDDVVKLIDKYEPKIVKSIWLQSDNIDDLAYRLGDLAADGSSKFLSQIADEVVTEHDFIWKLNAFVRGKISDTLLGNNLHANFPGIDYIDEIKRIIISNKTIDPRLKSYLNASQFKSKLMGYVDDLNDFTSGKIGGISIEQITVSPLDYDAKMLKLGMPDIQLSLDQQKALIEVINYAKSKGIKTSITVIK